MRAAAAGGGAQGRGAQGRRAHGGGAIGWAQVLAPAAVAAAFLWGATEWVAWRLAWQPQLGTPWLRLGGVPVYPPWAILPWWLNYGAYAPGLFARGGALACLGAAAAAAVSLCVALWRSREAGEADTYGSARWARPQEVRRAGLLGRDGLVLGRLGRRYLRHAGPEHVLCFAPTRSGKGVGLVTPSLLAWSGSAVVHDIKGENWALTAGFRAGFSRVLRFDPTDPACAAFNPLMEVRPGEREVADVQNIAEMLIDPQGRLERPTHWERTSQALLVGVMLHVLYAEPDKTLAGVARFLADPERPLEMALQAMLTTAHKDGAPHPVAAQAAQELLGKSEIERSGVVSTALSFLSLYRDPVVAAATSRSDWRIADLVEGERPASLYLVIPPSDLVRTRPLVRLILNQLCRRLTEDLQARSRGRRLLLMLDEFPSLGRLDFFEAALAFMAGYRLKAVLIAQSLNQIDKAYGPQNAILDNCHVRVAFATNDERTARRISDSLGVATELRAMRNYGGRRLAPWLSHVSVSRQETGRPLLTAGEVMQLAPDEVVIMVSGCPPIRARKARYLEDARLRRRVLPPPDAAGPEPGPPAVWTQVLRPCPDRPQPPAGPRRSRGKPPGAPPTRSPTPTPTRTTGPAPTRRPASTPTPAPTPGSTPGSAPAPALWDPGQGPRL